MIVRRGGLLHVLWNRVPRNRLRSSLTGLFHRHVTWSGHPRSRDALTAELARLDVEEVGLLDGDTRFIRLTGGPTFLKRRYAESGPSCARYWSLHRHLPEEVGRRIPKSYVDVAADVVLRYLYPHADPTVTPPYHCADRTAFHRQQRDTIDDVPGLSTGEKAALKRRFAIRPGDVLLDVGAYIGYGALRLSEMVGPTGQIVAVEADPANQEMFLRNMKANGIRNVRLIRKAIWRDSRELVLNCDAAQANSLIAQLAPPRHVVRVSTDSVDNLLRDEGLDKVTLVSLTVNGAEIEAIQGMDQTLRRFGPNLLIAGWYQRKGAPIHEHVSRFLKDYGYQVVLGREGRVYAWKPARHEPVTGRGCKGNVQA